MSLLLLAAVSLITVFAVALALLARESYKRALDLWLVPYVARSGFRPARRSGPVHVLLCIADHFEPLGGGVDPETANHRVQSWLRDYPRLFGEFRDSAGRPPRHTFFYPIDEYVPDHVDALSDLCRAGFGEIEIHLHHDNDTSEALRDRLLRFKQLFAERHGVLSRHKRSGELAYGFVHGNWALDNSRPDGRLCGVNDELTVLRETGCYADFTMPSVPSRTQTRKINSIYYATDDPMRPKSHDRGVDVGSILPPSPALLLVQGPLALDWKQAKWGIVPRVENGCIQGNQPAHIGRLDAWLKAGIQIRSRPDWVFVKLHTHGAPEQHRPVVLGEPMVQFHRDLAQRAASDHSFYYYYVTAREIYNLVRAAEAGWSGPVTEALDFELVWNARRAPLPAR